MQSTPIPSSPAFSGDFVHLFEHLPPPHVAEEIFLAHGPRGGGTLLFRTEENMKSWLVKLSPTVPG